MSRHNWNTRWGRLLLALLVGRSVVACSDANEPTTVSASLISTGPSSIVGGGQGKIWAWSWSGQVLYGPILTQPYNTLNPNVFRQVPTNFLDWYTIGDWAAANPGHRFIAGDECDIGCMAGIYSGDPARYAEDYCGFVSFVHNYKDPTATFGPSGFTRYVQDWWLNAFYNAYMSGPCSSIPIAEWSFHHDTEWSTPLSTWQSQVNAHVSWALNHGAPFVLGMWQLDIGFERPDGDAAYCSKLRAARDWIVSNPNITLARYLLYEPYPNPGPADHHPATDNNDQLTCEGIALTGGLY